MAVLGEEDRELGNVNLPFLMETKLSEKYFRLLRSMVSSFVLICPSACSFF